MATTYNLDDNKWYGVDSSVQIPNSFHYSARRDISDYSNPFTDLRSAQEDDPSSVLFKVEPEPPGPRGEPLIHFEWAPPASLVTYAGVPALITFSVTVESAYLSGGRKAIWAHLKEAVLSVSGLMHTAQLMNRAFRVTQNGERAMIVMAAVGYIVEKLGTVEASCSLSSNWISEPGNISAPWYVEWTCQLSQANSLSPKQFSLLPKFTRHQTEPSNENDGFVVVEAPVHPGGPL